MGHEADCAVRLVIQQGGVFRKAAVQRGGAPRDVGTHGADLLPDLCAGRVRCGRAVEIPADRVHHGGGLDPACHRVDLGGQVRGREQLPVGLPRFAHELPEFRRAIDQIEHGGLHDRNAVGAGALEAHVREPDRGVSQPHIVIDHVRAAEGDIEIPDGRGDQQAGIRVLIEVVAADAAVVFGCILLQNVHPGEGGQVEIFGIVPPEAVSAVRRVKRLLRLVIEAADIGDLPFGGALRGLQHDALPAFRHEAAELIRVAVAVFQLEQVAAVDRGGVVRDIDPLAAAEDVAVLHRAVGTGADLRQVLQIVHVGVRFLVVRGKVVDIHAGLADLHAFINQVVALIFAVDVQVRPAVIGREIQAHRVRQVGRQRVAEQRLIHVGRQQAPLFGLLHAEQTGLFIEFDVIGLLFVVPGGISAPLDLLELGVGQGDFAVFHRGDPALFLVRLIRVDVVQRPGFG